MNQIQTKDIQNGEANIAHQDISKDWRVVIVHPIQNVIRDIFKGVTTQHFLSKACNCLPFVSQKKVDEALINENYFLLNCSSLCAYFHLFIRKHIPFKCGLCTCDIYLFLFPFFLTISNKENYTPRKSRLYSLCL